MQCRKIKTLYHAKLERFSSIKGHFMGPGEDIKQLVIRYNYQLSELLDMHEPIKTLN